MTVSKTISIFDEDNEIKKTIKSKKIDHCDVKSDHSNLEKWAFSIIGAFIFFILIIVISVVVFFISAFLWDDNTKSDSSRYYIIFFFLLVVTFRFIAEFDK